MGLTLGEIEKRTGGDREMVARAGLAIGALEKVGVDAASEKCEVIVLLDISYSMTDEFNDGSVDKMLRRSLAYASTIDPDGKAQVVLFGQRAHRGNAIDLNNYAHWLRNNYPQLEGATYLGAGMELALQIAGEELDEPRLGALARAKTGGGLFGKKGLEAVATRRKAKVLVITDGEPHDGAVAERVQLNSSWGAVFWSYLYVSNQSGGRRFLENLDGQRGRHVDNSNAAFFPNIGAIDDQEFYAKVTKDFGDWVRFVNNPRNGLLTPA